MFTPKPIDVQKKMLEELLIKGSPVSAQSTDGMEGEFVILKWQKLAPTYCEALKKIMLKLKETREFKNWIEDSMDDQHLRMSDRTANALRGLNEKQEGDFITIRAQTGSKFRGESVKDARAGFSKVEFGLDSFSVACILLTHPERFQNNDDLWIDCAGDEYAPEADGVFTFASYWRFGDGRLRFDGRFVGYASDRYGSASGVRPECSPKPLGLLLLLKFFPTCSLCPSTSPTEV